MNELVLEHDESAETLLEETEMSDLGDAMSETKCWHWWPVVLDNCSEWGRN